MDDLISRQAAIELVRDVCNAILNECSCHYDSEVEDDVYDDIHEVDTILKCNKAIRKSLMDLPSAQPEPLTDKEQRIFLAAMGREIKVCEEVDRNYVREPYEDSLVSICKEIERKVKGALWT